MIDEEKIPKATYNELVELFGKERAEKIIIENRYNYGAITNTILEERFVKHLGIRKLRDKIIEKTGLPTRYLMIILFILGTLVYIFWPFRI